MSNNRRHGNDWEREVVNDLFLEDYLVKRETIGRTGDMAPHLDQVHKIDIYLGVEGNLPAIQCHRHTNTTPNLTDVKIPLKKFFDVKPTGNYKWPVLMTKVMWQRNKSSKRRNTALRAVTLTLKQFSKMFKLWLLVPDILENLTDKKLKKKIIEIYD